MKIPFTLDAWLKDKSQKVETRDGRPARIICTDARADDGACIIALIPGYGGEEAYQFFPNGHAFSSKSSDEDCADLFIITPEPELSEFEMKVSDFAEAYKLAATDCESEEYKTCNGNLQLIIKKYAAELLAVARKELEPEVLERLEVAYKNQDEVVYENGKRDGKAEALKDLPMWKKRDDFDYPTQFCGVVISGGQTTTLPVVIADGYEIPIPELLNKLPKEEYKEELL